MVHGEGYTLIEGDCLEAMTGLSGPVDAVITDPPFGINFSYATHNDTPEGYGDWIWECVELAESKCNPGSPVFVWQAMLNIRYLAQWFPRDWRLFCAAKNFVQMRPTAMQYAWDPVLVWWTPDKKPWAAGTSSRDFHIGNTANTLNRGDGNALGHPCARPLDQLRHIIRQWVPPGGIVLDPFMGSGTTIVAAIQEGRYGIGIDSDAGYFDIAAKRCADASRAARGLPKQINDTRRHDDLPLFAGGAHGDDKEIGNRNIKTLATEESQELAKCT